MRRITSVLAFMFMGMVTASIAQADDATDRERVRVLTEQVNDLESQQQALLEQHRENRQEVYGQTGCAQDGLVDGHENRGVVERSARALNTLTS